MSLGANAPVSCAYDSVESLHDISDEILGDVLSAHRFQPVSSNLLVQPHLAGTETPGAVVDLPVSGTEQRLVDARLGGHRVVATSGRTPRHRAEPVRTVLALHRDRRRTPLHIAICNSQSHAPQENDACVPAPLGGHRYTTRG